jgi:hypothetical protein
MANGTFPEPFARRTKYGETVMLKDTYTSQANLYTIPCDGFLNVRLSGNQTGAARICDSQSTTPYLQLGLATGSYTTYIPKGMRVYINGTVDAAYFMPLQ